MYEADAPAQNIHVLVRTLQQEDQGDFLYRGQVTHYGSILPSVFRQALSGSLISPHVHGLVSTGFQASLTGPRRYKFALMSHLIGTLGRGVGNIVAQQYGVGSEALDVTTDPTIAAFFATRQYPSYEHFAGSSEDSLGVIYRFRRDGRVMTLEQLEDGLSKLGHFTNDDTVVGWFGTRISRDDPPERIKAAERILSQYGTERLTLFSPPVIVDYATLTELLLSALQTGSGLRLDDLEDTRLGRQHGGFIRPPVHIRATVPAKRILDTAYLSRYREYSPNIAVTEEAVAVEDTMALPGIEIFFFRHSNRPIDSVTREGLWPSSYHDDLYDRLLQMCLLEPEIARYLEEVDTWAEDPDKGVIDRGFYTGMEPVVWQARIAQRQGDLQGALRLVNSALKVDDREEHYAVRAGISYEQGHLAESLRDLVSALKVNPDYWPAAASRIAILTDMGDLKGALSAATLAIQRHPRRAELYRARAQVYAAMSRPDLAVADCDEALKQVGHGSDAVMLETELLVLRALALTDWGKDAEAEAVLQQLEGRVALDRLKHRISFMRARRSDRA
jgi:hypothetical protein